LQGFGWAIAKSLADAGAEISLGVWVKFCLSSHG
jgi:enoyl-[acyl-carrier-protein] reductase (NADH)